MHKRYTDTSLHVHKRAAIYHKKSAAAPVPTLNSKHELARDGLQHQVLGVNQSLIIHSPSPEDGKGFLRKNFWSKTWVLLNGSSIFDRFKMIRSLALKLYTIYVVSFYLKSKALHFFEKKIHWFFEKFNELSPLFPGTSHSLYTNWSCRILWIIKCISIVNLYKHFLTIT